MTNEPTRFAEMLRRYIDAERITQKQLAAESGISGANLSRFLSGDTGLSAAHMLSLVQWALGTKPEPRPDLEARVAELEARTMGMVQLGGGRRAFGGMGDMLIGGQS